MIYLTVFLVMLAVLLAAMAVHHSARSYNSIRYDQVLFHDRRALLYAFLTILDCLLVWGLTISYL